MEDWRKPIWAIFIDFNEVKYTQQGLPVSLPELSPLSGLPPDLALLSFACTALPTINSRVRPSFSQGRILARGSSAKRKQRVVLALLPKTIC